MWSDQEIVGPLRVIGPYTTLRKRGGLTAKGKGCSHYFYQFRGQSDEETHTNTTNYNESALIRRNACMNSQVD